MCVRRLCVLQTGTTPRPPVLLSKDGAVAGSPVGHHYTVIDSNVVLHQMDVLEHAAVHDVVVPQTVLSEV